MNDQKKQKVGFIDFASGVNIHIDERFRVEPMNEKSFDSFYRLYSDVKLMKYIRKPMDLKTSQKIFTKLLKTMKTYKPKKFLCFIKTNAGEDAGVVGIIDKKIVDEYEIGVILFESFQKQGLSSKVKAAVLGWMFKQSTLIQVTTYCHPDNKVPNLINKKMKFEFKGRGDYPGYKAPMNKWSMRYNNYALINA